MFLRFTDATITKPLHLETKEEELYTMRIIKYSLILVISLVGILTFNSCNNDDGYNFGNYRVDIATVDAIDSSSGTFYLTLDNGKTLLPVASDSYYKPQYNKRALVNYTLLSDQTSEYDHAIKINAIQDILTKEVVYLTSENEEEIGKDPIKILDLWTGDHFLNIHFGYNTGGEKTHTINLVKNDLDKSEMNKIAPSPDGTITLEFRHNANGDPERYGIKSYAAFDLRPFQTANKDSINFIIKVFDFNDETKEYRITYKYK